MAVAREPEEGAGRENRVLRELVTIYHHLTGLALQNADLATVIDLLAKRTGAAVAAVSPTLEVLAAAGPAGDAGRERPTRPRLGRVLATAAQTPPALRLPAAEGRPSPAVAP